MRGLQRSIAKIARKIARERVESGVANEGLRIEGETVQKYLGPERFLHDEGINTEIIGGRQWPGLDRSGR